MPNILNRGMGKAKSSHLLLDALRAEMISGTESLDAWLKYLESHGGIPTLFEMECWLRGMRAFFDPRQPGMGAADRTTLTERNFAAELRIAQQAMRRCERLVAKIIGLGPHEQVDFDDFVEARTRKGSPLDRREGGISCQTTPMDSLVRLLEVMNDLRVLLAPLLDPARADCQAFISYGRCYRRELESCRFVEMLLRPRLRVQYDRVESPELSRILHDIPENRLRSDVALVFLSLFRLLKYLELMAKHLEQDLPLRVSLVIFALVHEEIASLTEFLGSRFVRHAGQKRKMSQAVELMIYSLKSDSQRVLERELTVIAHEPDARVIYGRIENSQGVLRNCLQSALITLARSFDMDLDARSVFPSMIESVETSQQVRQDLWNMRQSMKVMLEQKEAFALDAIIEQLAGFRENSMRYLMYRDWAEFERFSDAFVAAGGSQEVRTLLLQFVGYLEMLVREVSKRSVLQRAEPLPGQ